jgi:hypothetical protein
MLSLPSFLTPKSENATISLAPLRRYQFDFEALVAEDIVIEYDCHFLLSLGISYLYLLFVFCFSSLSHSLENLKSIFLCSTCSAM